MGRISPNSSRVHIRATRVWVLDFRQGTGINSTTGKLDKHDSLKPVIGEFNGKQMNQLTLSSKAVLRLSHASSVAIVTLNNVPTREGFSVLSVIKSLLATETKDVVLLVSEEKYTEWTNAISSCVDLKLLKKPVHVSKLEACRGSSRDDVLQASRSRVINDGRCSSSKIYWQLVVCDKEGGLWVECAAELIEKAEADVSHVTKTSESTWPGDVIAAGMYTLNCCPIHSRYFRRGLGQHTPLQQSEFMMTSKELTTLMSKFEVSFSTEEVADLIKKTNTSASNAMTCLNVEA
ncbi:hypothetical protein OS493_009639 [Desmophyllum pertusum]|uniref:Uncharacterized protein n=1 Tax=Desmophyllum pertusum TaxID=174260 RepID=A0A9W9YU40_9CNID|nr:hypothetical protein OS493_009639 [Desmophyllum pertusum]